MPNGLVLVFCVVAGVVSLLLHVRIYRRCQSVQSTALQKLAVRTSDFRDIRVQENDGQDEDEEGDGEVHVLDVGEVIVINILEEDVGGEDGADDGSDTVQSLRDVETDFGVLRPN